MTEKGNTQLREVYFIIAMASHILALRLFLPEYSEYNLAFSVALSLPVVYTIKMYQKELYLRKGKYFVLKREWKERIVNEISLFIMSLAIGYALYISFGGQSPTWFIIGFGGAWTLRLITFTVVDCLDRAGIPVEKPPIILVVGFSLGITIGSLVGFLLSLILS